MKIDTLLFDLDGTLIDTNELIIDSFLYTLNIYKPGEYGREDVIPFIGPPLIDTFTKIDEKKAKEMVKTYRDHNHKMHDTLIAEYEGVYETIEQLHKDGYNLAIVTTKIHKTALMGLEVTGLKKFFDVVVGLDDVTNAKPHTEPLEKALAQLGVSKEGAMMIGDSKYDILAGKNLGIPTVAVGWTIQGEEHVRSFEPDYVISNMRELLTIVKNG